MVTFSPPRIIVTTNFQQLRDFQGRFLKNLPEMGVQLTRGAAVRIANRLRRYMQLHNMVGSGYASKKSGGTKVVKGARGVYYVQMPAYIRAVESGTSKHWIPRTRKAEQWAKRHNMTFKSLQQAIAKRGTRPNPFTREVVQNAQGEILADMARRLTNKARV